MIFVLLGLALLVATPADSAPRLARYLVSPRRMVLKKMVGFSASKVMRDSRLRLAMSAATTLPAAVPAETRAPPMTPG